MDAAMPEDAPPNGGAPGPVPAGSLSQISGSCCASAVEWGGACGEPVGDRPGVAGHAGRGGVDLVQEQGQGAGDAGAVGLLEFGGDRIGSVGDGARQPADDCLAGDGPVLVGVAQVGVEVAG